ncbi:uncharacterized protein [Drosophila kikkawai]|uniref:Uncharacterized protein n=1 Tax=Drosophila kikkawai TaxID=30033 RepID=A0A6P4IMY5_DROKI|nr:uncharacterized protein LOC108075823 [Drosophila kikkawai]
MLSKVFCMGLNTYGLVIGWLGVVCSILEVIPLFVVVGLLVGDDKSVDDEKRSNLVIVLSIGLPVVVINLLISGMLIMGTVKKRHLLLLPWLIWSGVCLALISLADFCYWVLLLSSPSLAALPILLFSVAFFVLQWYLYNGIYSLYREIQAKRPESVVFARHTEAPPE